MFFILSKILTFLLSPFTYLVILLLWMLFTKNAVRRKKLLITSVILIFVFGNNFLLDEAVRLWEKPISKTRTQNYDIAIVLGGMIIYDVQNDISRFNSSVDRLLQALPKIKNGEIKHENALFSRELLQTKFKDLSNKKILLITSASHMRRSLACFEKQGLSPDYLCSNRSAGPRKFELEYCFIPGAHVFSGWTHLTHEIIGYWAYKLTGKI